jgi:hypothetical protein
MQVSGQGRNPDPEAHEPGCLKAATDEPWADPSNTHMDVFCDCHRFTQPKVLSNGTDIAWPAGWGEKQAEDWRERNNWSVHQNLERGRSNTPKKQPK